jgi:hypothetical protein
MNMLGRLLERVVLVLGVIAVIAGPTSAARADSSGWLSVPDGAPLFDLVDIAPGNSGSATFTITNPQSVPVQFSIGVPSIDTNDNGCNEPEAAAGDLTCGEGGGELQFDLRLTLSATGGNERMIGSGTLTEWVAQPRVDLVALAGYESRTYRVSYELPSASSNVTQSDRVAFAFEMRLEEVLDSLQSDAPSVLVDATPALPGTGFDAGALTTIALSLSAVGVALYSWSIYRRRMR